METGRRKLFPSSSSSSFSSSSLSSFLSPHINETRFLISTNVSCQLEKNGNHSPLQQQQLHIHHQHTAQSALHVQHEDDFLADVLPPLPLSPTTLRTIQRNLSHVVAGDGYPVLSEETLPDGVWTPEVIFRVSTIAVLIALTLVGNTALISVITCHASLRRKRVSVFLLNLAVADLMVCVVTMTTEILFVAFGEWVLGAVACKVIVYGQIVTLASTTFLLTAMSIDRYQVLVKPLQTLRGPPHICRKMILSWSMALLFATPQLFIFVQSEEERPSDGQPILTCKSVGYTAEWQRKVYFSFMTIYILIIPTAVMSFCYFSIIRIVWVRTGGRSIDAPRIHFVTSRKADPLIGRSTPGACQSKGPPPPAQSQTVVARANRVVVPAKASLSSKRTVVKMTLSVIVGFVVCWTPYFVVSLIRIFTDYRIQIVHALSVSEIMALAHSALNPILYMVFSTRALRNTCWQMRRRLTAVLTRRRRRPRLTPDHSTGGSDWNQGRASGPAFNKGRTEGGGGGGQRGGGGVPARKGRRVFLAYTRRFLDAGSNLPQQQLQLFHPVQNNAPFQEEVMRIGGDGRTRTTTYVARPSSSPSETVERTANHDYYN